MDEPWVPALEVRQTGRRCRLSVGGRAFGHGATLQEAADDLVVRLLTTAMALRITAQAVFTYAGATAFGCGDTCFTNRPRL